MHLRITACAVLALAALAPQPGFAAPLRAGDRVAIAIFNQPGLSVPQGSVDADGKIAVPLAGNVAVAGLEPAAAASRIAGALRPYLRRPAVTVALLQQNATITLVGGPGGVFPYAPGQTLTSALGPLAALPGLDLHRVGLERDGKPLGAYDGVALLRGGAPGPALQPGDRILVGEKPVAVAVRGVVKTPGTVHLDAGQTLADAIAAAGGAGDDAATGALDLAREGQHARIALSSEALAQPARDGDVLTVPQAVHVSVAGSVAHPGDTALTAGTTLVAALYQAGGPVKYADISHVDVLRDGTRRTYDVTKLRGGDMSQNPHLAPGDLVYVPEGRHVDFRDIFAGLSALRFFL